MPTYQVDYIILGAGCAGLSMAVQLLQAFPTSSIALIDTRQHYTRDHTWCFWQLEAQAWYSPAISHQWQEWSVTQADNHQHYHTKKYPYVHINALDYYALAQNILAAGNVQWLLNTQNSAINANANFVEITTANSCIRGRYLFDSRPPVLDLTTETDFLIQCFRGWHIKTTQPCFDPKRVQLMDFRLPQYQQIHFMYLLPFSTTEALIEPTFFLNRVEDFSAAVYEQTLRDYLHKHYALTEFTILHTEAGRLPMINKTFNRHPESRWYKIGAAAGLLRPSTGYGFCGIQRYNQQLVTQLQQKDLPAAPSPYSTSSQWMDKLLLKVLHAEPSQGANLLMGIFTNAPAESVIRFLNDAATYKDIWRMLNAVPRYAFLKAYLTK